MDALFEATLSNVLLALPLALAAWALARRGGSPALVHGLWLVVLLKLVTPPLFTVHVALPTRPQAAPEARWARPPAAPLPGDLELPGELPTTAVQDPTPLAEPLAPDPASPPIPWRTLLLAVWILGTLATWMLAAQRIRLFRALIRLSARAPARIEREARTIADRLGLARTPELRVVPGRLAPMLWSAGGRAQLVLPEELLPRLGGSARRTLLAHELAHFKRRDHLVRWLELAVRGLHWWNPLARWSVRGLRAAEESCCDAWVVWALPGTARTYAGALVETADFLSGAAPLPATGAGAFSHARELERRLTMILHADTSKSLSRRGRLGLLAVALAALPFLPAFSQDPGDGDTRVELADIERRLGEVQTRRAQLADRLAVLELEGEGLRPAHSRHKQLQDQLAQLTDEAASMEAMAADLQAEANWRNAALAREQADARASAADERRAALKLGAEALMEKGDLHAAKVLLGMLDEMDGGARDRWRRVDPLAAREDQYTRQLAEYFAKLRDEGQANQPDQAAIRRWLAAVQRQMGEADQQADALRAYEQALAIDPARRIMDPRSGRTDDSSKRDEDRLQRLEDRMNSLTNMVERLAHSLESGRATRDAGGDR